MKILIASNNTHKIKEFYEIFSELNLNIEICTPSELNIDINVDETGSTFEYNAELKARAFYNECKLPVIADDTGLEVEALNGLPGVYSSRYAGNDCIDSNNRKKLIAELQKSNAKDWSAQFKTVICYLDGQITKFYYGICKGKITDKEKGNNGFGYDSIFIPDKYKKTFAELSEIEKNNISHRGNAIRYFANDFKNNIYKMRLGFLASGTGSNMEAILNNIVNNNLIAEAVILITNNSDSKATKIAKSHGLEVRHISSAQFNNDNERDEAIANALINSRVDLIILAGYMKKVGSPILKQFPNRILNIHPALLPKYGGHNYFGMNVHKAVIENNEKESGCTIHIVNDDYDKGKIIAQRKVKVLPKDSPETLQKRILKEEHILYSDTINKIINGEIKLD